MNQWNGPAVKSLRKALMYSQDEFAEVLGVNRTTLIRWEGDKTKPNAASREKLRALEDDLVIENAYTESLLADALAEGEYNEEGEYIDNEGY